MTEVEIVRLRDGLYPTSGIYFTAEVSRLAQHALDLRAAMRELLRVDDDWHGAINSEMAAARCEARHLLEVASAG